MTATRFSLAALLLAGTLCMQPAPAEDARPPMPPMTIDLNSSSYPTAALKTQLQGRVLVAFNITKRGRADAENVVEAEPQELFDAAALNAVKKVKFTVPADWEDQAGPLQRYRLSVVFKLYPCTDPCVQPKAHADADDFIIISAQVR